MDSDNLRANLMQFTGSSEFTRHGLSRRVLMTEGVEYLANQAAAYWLTDAVVSYLPQPHVLREPFQVWTLKVDPQHHAVLTMTDGNTNKPIVEQVIDYTDFPLSEIQLWLVGGGDTWTLMLPSEY